MEKVEVLLWRHYINAIETCLFYFIDSCLLCICQVLFNFLWFIPYRIITICHSFKGDRPLTGCRKSIIGYLYKLISTFILFFAGMRSSKRKVDFDYSAYLGINYKETTKPPKYLSTYVSNHISWLDVPIIIANLKPAFASKKTFKKTPIFGIIV